MWGYSTVDGGSGNLSTTQFACLGLWSAERLGTPVAERAWLDHLDALCRSQGPDGSWPYYLVAGATIEVTYPTGTFMGLADLVLAQHALAERLEQDPPRRARAVVARQHGMAALRRHFAWVLPAAAGEFQFGSTFEHYRLFALEKVALFLDVGAIGGREWYREGARRLLDTQRADGSWGNGAAGWAQRAGGRDLGNAVDTSFALLFLLRISETYRPVTPRSVDPGPPVTPRSAPTEPPPEPTAPAAAVGLPLAWEILARLENHLRAPTEAGFGGALDVLRFVRRTYRTYRPGGTPLGAPHDAWCRRAQALLLAAALDRAERPSSERVFAQALALEATDVLGDTDEGMVAALLQALEDRRTTSSWPPDVAHAWRSAALDALLRVDTRLLLPWLLARGFEEGELDWQRLSPVLMAAGGLRGLRGTDRRALLAGAMARLEPLLAGRLPTKAWHAALQRDAWGLVQRLGRTTFPTLPRAQPDARAPLAWWKAHRDPADPAWNDP
jgi:hypothetical protein